MKKQLLVFILSFQASFLAACTCNVIVDEFCHSADSLDHIAMVKLIEFDDETAAQFSLIDSINMTLPDTFGVFGQDGLNCLLELYQFEVGDTLIFNMRFHPNGIENWITGNTYYYSIDGCSRHYLHYSNGKVLGNIDGVLTEMEYVPFKQGILTCFDFELNNNELLTQEFLIYPNPSQGELQIKSSTLEVLNFALYDLKGKSKKFSFTQSQNSWIITFDNQDTGIHILAISTSKGILRKKFLLVN